jgi:hypothetical protein
MPAGYHVPAVMKEMMKAVGGDALLERIAAESALGGEGLRDLAPRELPPTD